MTCARTQGFLAQRGVGVAVTVNAKSRILNQQDALALLKGVDQIYAMKRKQVVHLDLKAGKPSRDELLAVLLGPTGNLRAPTVRKGRTLLVGFEEGTYGHVLK